MRWFITGLSRGAECLGALFPSAELFTLLAEPRAIPEGLRGRPLHTSLLQRLPLARRFHRHLLPLYPTATESLDLRGFDLVISSDSGPVKGVRLDSGAKQICYCHSPMRYLYDGYEAYRASMGGVTRAAFTATAARVRRWDQAAAGRVTDFIANSHYVADRIKRVYRRESTVIPPPIDLSRARRDQPGDHYLAAGRLVPYKRTELMIEACQKLGRSLRIVGAGPDLARLRRLAGPETTFVGEVSTDDLWAEYARCRALLFAADEDFGMVPLEAQACGRPVIAYGAGGSLETVRGRGPEPTGIFFERQTATSLADAILRFEAAEGSFAPEVAHEWAESFRTQVFLERVRSHVLEVVPEAASVMSPVPESAAALAAK